MKFKTLDPRDPKKVPQAVEQNNKIFRADYRCVCGNAWETISTHVAICEMCGSHLSVESGEITPHPVLGIEVTIAALAERCNLGNIDPQHTGGDASVAAIEVALTAELPPKDATLVTVRPDLDSVGAMAVLNIRSNIGTVQHGVEDQDTQYLFDTGVDMIATADKFACGEWKSKLLPTAKQPWDKNDFPETAAIAAAISDHEVPFSTRVGWMEEWLFTRAEPEGYRARVEAERAEMIRAIEEKKIKSTIYTIVDCDSCKETLIGRDNFCSYCGIPGTEVWCQEIGKGSGAPLLYQIAVVVSTHRFATQLGYSCAPIVICLNPEFRIGEGDPHRKFTICQYQAGYVDLEKVQAELNQLEPGWGGQPNIKGSPQGTNSTLTVEKILEILEKNLLKRFL